MEITFGPEMAVITNTIFKLDFCRNIDSVSVCFFLLKQYGVATKKAQPMLLMYFFSLVIKYALYLFEDDILS